jgi:hypothetical protein
MSELKCKSAPMCEYSKKKNKCIKPNPYIEYIAKCNRDNIHRDTCKKDYKLNKLDATQNACKNYLSRIALQRKQININILNPDETLKYLELRENELLKELKLLEKERKNKLKELNKDISPIPIKKTSFNFDSINKEINNIDVLLKDKSKKSSYVPLVKKKSLFHIENRNNHYSVVSKYINSRKKYSNNCLRVYKVNNDIPIFRIGNRIILTKRIGSDSAYGVVYYSYYRKNKNDNYMDDIIFATKIIDNINHNNIEYSILETLTSSVINNEFIHFPITYGLLECYNKNTSNDYNSDISLSRNKLSLNKYIPSNLAKMDGIYIILTELANGDLEYFYADNYSDDEVMLNTLVQILLSLMFFYKKINAFHADAHNGNFLFHKVKPGGYFHYNIYGVDYYLKNIGYLWVIWDFGLIKPFANSLLVNNNKYGNFTSYESITSDYEYILSGFRNTDIRGGWVSTKYRLSDNINIIINNLYHVINRFFSYDINTFPELNINLLSFLTSNISSFTLIRPIHILNKEPYIIN